MAFWICEAQSTTEEQACLHQGYICCGDDAITVNLNDYPESKDLTFFFEEICGLEFAQARTLTADCWPFAYEMALGDIVLLENLETSILHVGTVSSDYQCLEEQSGRAAQRRSVAWFALGLEREGLPSELLAALHACQGHDLMRLSPEQEESLSAYLVACCQQHLAQGHKPQDQHMQVLNAGLGAVTPLSHEAQRAFLVQAALDGAWTQPRSSEVKISPEQLVLMHLKLKLASGELNMTEVVTELIKAIGLVVTDVPESTTKIVTVVSAAQNNNAVKVLWQVRTAPMPLTLQVLDFMEGILPIYKCQRAMLVSLSGFADDLTAAVKTGQPSFQVVLWGPNEIARELLAQRQRLSPSLRQALELD